MMSSRKAGHDGLTRRETLQRMGAAGLGLTALGGGLEALLAGEAMAAPAHGSLKDIEHVIFLIQENRSFDHYFGTFSGVRGFGDKQGAKAFRQKTSAAKDGQPFKLPSGPGTACPTSPTSGVPSTGPGTTEG